MLLISAKSIYKLMYWLGPSFVQGFSSLILTNQSVCLKVKISSVQKCSHEKCFFAELPFVDLFFLVYFPKMTTLFGVASCVGTYTVSRSFIQWTSERVYNEVYNLYHNFSGLLFLMQFLPLAVQQSSLLNKTRQQHRKTTLTWPKCKVWVSCNGPTMENVKTLCDHEPLIIIQLEKKACYVCNIHHKYN